MLLTSTRLCASAGAAWNSESAPRRSARTGRNRKRRAWARPGRGSGLRGSHYLYPSRRRARAPRHARPAGRAGPLAASAAGPLGRWALAAGPWGVGRWALASAAGRGAPPRPLGRLGPGALRPAPALGPLRLIDSSNAVSMPMSARRTASRANGRSPRRGGASRLPSAAPPRRTAAGKAATKMGSGSVSGVLSAAQTRWFKRTGKDATII